VSTPTDSREPTGSPLGANVRVGISALFANPLRTVLSTLGVIIGVASLVAVLSVGDGLEDTLRAQLETTTSVQFLNLVPVTSEEVDGQTFPLDSYPQFSVADTRAAGAIAGLSGVTADLTGRGEASDSARVVRRLVSVIATTESRQALNPVTLLAGRFLSAADVDDAETARVVVSRALAARFATAAGLDGPAAMLDRTVLLEQHPFRVVGVTADSSDAEVAFISLARVEQALPASARPRQVILLAKLARVEDADTVRAVLGKWADATFGSGTTRLRSNEGRLAQATQGILLFKLFMGSITGISLLVGGIGIMNVLLASVTERTREIGIRKAMGAKRRDVLWQFLAESVAVASLGSGIGVALGLTGAFSITAIMRARFPGMAVFASVSWSTILVAVVSALIVGLVFGTYPARRAARLDPIDAIRHE
jgi:putative ABC transport system permease protein